MRLRDKVIVIIGGTGGIGLAAAHTVITEGARLVAVGLDEAGCRDARRVLGEDVEILMADARQPEAAERAIAAAHARFGSFDALYHVAGGSGRRWGDGPLHELTDEGVESTLRLNLHSVLWSNRAAVRDFLRRDQPGVVLNLASVLAVAPAPEHFGTLVYAAAKSAVIGSTRAAAAQYASRSIRFNALAPGLVNTPSASRALTDDRIRNYVDRRQRLDGGRPVEPEELAAAAVYLLSDESRFVTGQVLYVDGGWTVCGPDSSPPSDLAATHPPSRSPAHTEPNQDEPDERRGPTG